MNRRNALGLAATALGLGLPARVVAQAPGPIMETLSAYMSTTATRALPDDVAEHAKHHLLDSLAAMVSGSELPPGQAAQRYIALTPAEVQNAFRKWLRPADLVRVTQGPPPQ